MKTKMIIWASTLAILALALASCDNGGTHPIVDPPCASCEPPIVPPEKESLVGTSWEFVGFFDVEKGELREQDREW